MSSPEICYSPPYLYISYLVATLPHFIFLLKAFTIKHLNN